jgi:hypothetical protein
MFAQYESIELMSPAVLKQLYGVLGEVLLHALQHQTVKGKHRRWSTGATLPRAEKVVPPPELEAVTAQCEIKKDVRKRKGFSMRFSMWRGAADTGADSAEEGKRPEKGQRPEEGKIPEEGKKRKLGWFLTYLGFGAKKPPKPDMVQEIHPQ